MVGALVSVWPPWALTVKEVMVWEVQTLTSCPSIGVEGKFIVPFASVPDGFIINVLILFNSYVKTNPI